MNNKNFYGDDIRWFMGIVTDIQDPLELGRFRVRIHGIHGDSISDDVLPWSQPIVPLTEGGTRGLGNNLGIQVGSRVIGIFTDGRDSQNPIVLGSLPKFEGEDREPSTNELARGENNLTKSLNNNLQAPSDPYNASYPENKVYATRSGHTIEIDDTDNAERIHIYHKSGSRIEFYPDGQIVVKGDGVYIDAGSNSNISANNAKIEIADTTDIISTTINSTSTTLNANSDVVNVSGRTVNINGSSGDVVVRGISLVNHTHTDPAGISGRETSTPN